VIVSGIYLILVIGFVAFTFPQPEEISHKQLFYDQLRSELKEKLLGSENSERYRSEKQSYLEKARQRGLITEIEMPNGYIMTFSSELPEKEVLVVVERYWNIVKNEANEKRIHYLLLASLWWVLPVLALYGLGWSIGWVYRGFRKQ